MQKQSTATRVESRNLWGHLEEFVRGHIQQFVQRLLVEEVTMRLGRAKSARRVAVDAPEGYRNGYGKPRKLTLTCGTITVQRPRVRNLAERFVSRLLPLFQRRTKQVGELLPQLYLHGLALGDFELALRGVLGDGAPLSPTSLQRLKVQWEEEYTELLLVLLTPPYALSACRSNSIGLRYPNVECRRRGL
jgi:putative transposase